MTTRKTSTKMPVSRLPVMVSIVSILLAPLAAYGQPVETRPAGHRATAQWGDAITIAQSNTDNLNPPATPAQRRYLVEVIIFNNLGAISSSGEMWHRESPINFDPDMYTTPEADSDAAIPPGNPGSEILVGEVPVGEIPDEENPVQYTEIQHLVPHLLKLSSDPAYEVVTHVAWTQPLYEKRESVRVPVTWSPPDPAAPGQPDASIKPSVTGSIQVFENRLLFVDININNEFPAEALDFSAGAQLARPPGVYRLQEKRRVKLNELHYFDHPFFGALVRVSRVEP